jgi:hypothetical protein
MKPLCVAWSSQAVSCRLRVLLSSAMTVPVRGVNQNIEPLSYQYLMLLFWREICCQNGVDFAAGFPSRLCSRVAIETFALAIVQRQACLIVAFLRVRIVPSPLPRFLPAIVPCLLVIIAFETGCERLGDWCAADPAPDLDLEPKPKSHGATRTAAGTDLAAVSLCLVCLYERKKGSL